MVMRSVTQWQIKACKIVRSSLCEKVIEPYNFERLTVNKQGRMPGRYDWRAVFMMLLCLRWLVALLLAFRVLWKNSHQTLSPNSLHYSLLFAKMKTIKYWLVIVSECWKINRLPWNSEFVNTLTQATSWTTAATWCMDKSCMRFGSVVIFYVDVLVLLNGLEIFAILIQSNVFIVLSSPILIW